MKRLNDLDPKVVNSQNTLGDDEKKNNISSDSYFDGNTLQFIGILILYSLITIFSIGIAVPWAECMIYRWKMKHTVINSRRLKFNGRGIQLFGKYILWYFLTIITLGIYSIWLGLGVEKWLVKHTVFEDDESNADSIFTGTAGGWFFTYLGRNIITLLTLGIAGPWAECMVFRWKANNTVIGGYQLSFNGRGFELFKKSILYAFLSAVTLGIFLIFVPVKLVKWQTSCYSAYKKTAYSKPVALFKKLTDLEYLRLNKFEAFLYKLKLFFCAIPLWFKKLGKGILNFFKNCGLSVKNEFGDIGYTFKNGNWAVKLSFFIFGFGNLYYGQILRGILFLLFELVFIGYMVVPSGGIYWLSKGNWFRTGATIGTVQGRFEYDAIYDTDVWVQGDDSVKVMLYGLLTIIFIIAFIYTWRLQVKQCRICLDITAKGKKVRSGKDDLKSLLDDQFHKTLLSVPLFGIMAFTVLPIIYMVLVAFTSYDAAHDGYSNLFSWVGLEHFNELFDFGKGGLGLAFGEILSWTLMWAFFATFSNYFLGMFVAIMINKKGIKIKKFWRTVLVMTIAIPQFVSLLYVSKLFDSSGIIGKLLGEIPAISEYLGSNHFISLWDSPIVAKILVIVINIWIGIPYIMLMATGILMNIPADLYESSRIDGASPWQQYSKITLPYMMFVMGPYLLTSFVGNLNNFNVIYLLTGGNPLNTTIGTAGGASVGHTDLLITWLFKMTLGSTESKYYMASLIGILVFVVVAVLSLIVYNVIPSTRNEEDYK